MTPKLTPLQKFLLVHPLCFACGQPAVEQDHLPSRACFDDKHWPEGFAFPVCSTHNRATANDEQIIAALTRADSGPDAPVKADEVEKYMKGGANNDAALFATLLKGVVHTLPDGRELVEMGPGVREVFSRVLPKWARAFHYMETREILPQNTLIYGGHFTVPGLEQNKVAQYFLRNATPRPVTRNKKDLGPQFGFGVLPPSTDGNLFGYLVLFRRAIGAWMIINKGPKHRDDAKAQSALLRPLKT